jgi:biopolymer transport protein ExbB
MYALLAASVFAVSVAIERYIYFAAADSGARFADRASELLRAGKYDETRELCRQNKGANAQIVFKTLELLNAGPQFIEKRLESEAGVHVAGLRRGIPYLGIIVTMSPLLGLLGTVIGMIGSFNVYALQAGQPHAITGGVGEALNATASGLCVALVALVAHSYFAQRIDTILTDMERTFSALLESMYRGKAS